jgi:hypothetical protein
MVIELSNYDIEYSKEIKLFGAQNRYFPFFTDLDWTNTQRKDA